MVYIGVDLHRKTTQVAAVNGGGELLVNRKVPTSGPDILRVFGEVVAEAPPAAVAFEATFGWGWFADLLRNADIEVHMAHPLATKAIANARVKNDAVDAKTLAHLLRAGMLPEAWAAPLEVREARRLVRMRTSRWLRWVMVEAAVRALGNPQLGVFYTSIEKRRAARSRGSPWPVGC